MKRGAAAAAAPLLLLAAGLTVVAAGSAEVEVVAPPGPYLDQVPPGVEPILFAEGVVSTDDHDVSCAFTPNGRELYFGRFEQGSGYRRFFLFTSRRAGSDDIYWVDASIIDRLREKQLNER
jgi:hypothetical protein